MSLSIGIVGLPNVGKSTLFNALIKKAQAKASNFPFCTIDPNIGMIEILDERLEKIQEVAKSQKLTPATIKFIDIAGLVKGAHKGEGLGNQFLSHIREVSVVALLNRFFEDKDITHTSEKIDPIEDTKTIITELALADLKIIESSLEKVRGQAKTGNKNAKEKIEILEKIQNALDKDQLATLAKLNDEELKGISDQNLLTLKPIIFIANLSEKQIKDCGALENYKDLEKFAKEIKSQVLPISAKVESELIDFSPQEQKEYLESLNLKESGLSKIIKASFEALNLITFFTYNPNELRAWNIQKGSTALDAAGKVHTDFAEKFIKAEVISFDKLIEIPSWQKAKEQGKISLEGKDYKISDGDVIYFQHG